MEQFNQQYRIPFQKQNQWRKYLQQNGFVVISEFLSREICQKSVDQFWKIIQKLSQGKLKEDDLLSQANKENYPPSLNGGMIQYIGHSKPQWQLRQLCKDIFQKVWNKNNLKTSFDGFCFMNGPLNFQKKPITATLHTDQSPTRNYLWCYQGVITLTDAGQDQGGFVCIPKSHQYHQQFFKKINKIDHKKDWFPIPEQQKLQQPFCNAIKVNSKAGDFILFDGRTFHGNTCPLKKNLRACSYICMIPSEKIDQETLQERRVAFQKRATTSHYPGAGFRIFPEFPQIKDMKIQNLQEFSKTIKQINSFELTQKMKELI